MFSVKSDTLYEWKMVTNASDVKDFRFLRYFCTKVHELAGWGKVNVINNYLLDKASIVYKNPMYSADEIKFLQYTIEPAHTLNDTGPMDSFYITRGLKDDCIFYLVPLDRQRLHEFQLGLHVCGIHQALVGTKKATAAATEQPTKDADVSTQKILPNEPAFYDCEYEQAAGLRADAPQISLPLFLYAPHSC